MISYYQEIPSKSSKQSQSHYPLFGGSNRFYRHITKNLAQHCSQWFLGPSEISNLLTQNSRYGQCLNFAAEWREPNTRNKSSQRPKVEHILISSDSNSDSNTVYPESPYQILDYFRSWVKYCWNRIVSYGIQYRVIQPHRGALPDEKSTQPFCRHSVNVYL